MSADAALAWRVHPAADLFPLIQGADFDRLVEDIRTNGLMEPIVLDVEGALIDGRNRARACARLGIEPRTRVYDGGDVVQFVVSHNLHRRHLTDSQRAMIAAELAVLPSGRPPVTPPYGGVTSPDQANVADLMQVPVRTMQRAKSILRNGSPDLRALVKETNVPLESARRVAALPHADQDDYVEKVRAGADPVKAAPLVSPPKGAARPADRLAMPQPPRYGGNRRKHLQVIEAMAASLAGLAMAAEQIDELDSTVTPEEAARLAGDLSTSIRSLNRLKQTLTRKATS